MVWVCSNFSRGALSQPEDKPPIYIQHRSRLVLAAQRIRKPQEVYALKLKKLARRVELYCKDFPKVSLIQGFILFYNSCA